jgi:hypothetical protein
VRSRCVGPAGCFTTCRTLFFFLFLFLPPYLPWPSSSTFARHHITIASAPHDVLPRRPPTSPFTSVILTLGSSRHILPRSATPIPPHVSILVCALLTPSFPLISCPACLGVDLLSAFPSPPFLSLYTPLAVFLARHCLSPLVSFFF